MPTTTSDSGDLRPEERARVRAAQARQRELWSDARVPPVDNLTPAQTAEASSWISEKSPRYIGMSDEQLVSQVSAQDKGEFLSAMGLPFNRQRAADPVFLARNGDNMNAAFVNSVNALRTPGEKSFEVSSYGERKRNVTMAVSEKGQLSGFDVQEVKKKGLFGKIAKMALTVASVIPSPIQGAAILANSAMGALNAIKNNNPLGLVASVAGGIAGGIGDAVSAGAQAVGNVAGKVATYAGAANAALTAYKERSPSAILGAVASGAGAVSSLVGNAASGVARTMDKVSTWVGRGSKTAQVAEGVSKGDLASAAEAAGSLGWDAYQAVKDSPALSALTAAGSAQIEPGAAVDASVDPATAAQAAAAETGVTKGIRPGTTPVTSGAGAAATRPPLVDQIDASLPHDRFDYPWQRDRILERVQTYQGEVDAALAGGVDDAGSVAQLRSRLGADFSPDAVIELHGVASHFGPEGMQAHSTDRLGHKHVWVRDSEQRWVERADLAQKANYGEIPSSEPGRTTIADGSATFAVTSVSPGGEVQTRVPDLSRFDHSPTLAPYTAGRIVQLPRKTGYTEQRKKGEVYLPAERTAFYRIDSTDGKGSWNATLMTPDDKPVIDDATGAPITRVVTDAELRNHNSPSVLRAGFKVRDMSVDPDHPAQRRMIESWLASDELKTAGARPGTGASPDQIAAWEQGVLTAVDGHLDPELVYPPASNLSQAYKDNAKLMARIGAEYRAKLKADPSFAKTQAAKNLAKKWGAIRGDLYNNHPKATEIRKLTSRINALKQGSPALQIAPQAASQTVSSQIAALEHKLELTKLQRDAEVSLYDDGGIEHMYNIGQYVDAKTGVCRHQAVAAQILLQEMGIESRLAYGAAVNPGNNKYRGPHLWLEVTLSNGEQILLDPTWDDSKLRLRQVYRSSARQENSSKTYEIYKDSLVWHGDSRVAAA